MNIHVSVGASLRVPCCRSTPEGLQLYVATPWRNCGHGENSSAGTPWGTADRGDLCHSGATKKPFEDKLEPKSSREKPREKNGGREEWTSEKHQQDTVPSTASKEIMMPAEKSEQDNCDMGWKSGKLRLGKGHNNWFRGRRTEGVCLCSFFPWSILIRPQKFLQFVIKLSKNSQHWVSLETTSLSIGTSVFEAVI